MLYTWYLEEKKVFKSTFMFNVAENIISSKCTRFCKF